MLNALKQIAPLESTTGEVSFFILGLKRLNKNDIHNQGN